MFSCVVCQGVDSRGERLWDKGYEAAVRGSVAATPGPTAHQAAVPFTISQSLLRLTSIESVVPSNHLVLLISILSISFQETKD